MKSARMIWSALAVTACLVRLSPAAAQAVPLSQAARVRAGLADAQTYAEQGHFSQAARKYAAILEAAARAGDALHATALYGRASSLQQAAALPDSASLSSAGSLSLVADYDAAARLDPSRYQGAASNNAGLLLLKIGHPREAAARFVEAAGTDHPARAYFWWNAGRAYEAAGQPDSAGWAYRATLTADSTYSEAGRALLNLDLKAGRGDSIIARVSRWQGLPDFATPASDVLLAVITDESKQPPNVTDSALVLFARYLTLTQPNPELFRAKFGTLLAKAGKVRPNLRRGVSALQEAYKRRGGKERFKENDAAEWWHQSTGRSREAIHSKAGIWSTNIRILGDFYRDAGSPDVAASYYEAAIGLPGDVGGSWTDPDALLPLALIYLRRNSKDYDVFIRRAFMGKAQAYSARDYPRVRYFHMALGQLFAEQGQWGDRYDPRGAIFQLEHMQRATEEVARETGEPVYDPPQLLELLARGYKEKGDSQMARRTANAASVGFERLARGTDAARIQRDYGLQAPPEVHAVDSTQAR
jgi:tetratricopeptide (TPR) repeat protein